MPIKKYHWDTSTGDAESGREVVSHLDAGMPFTAVIEYGGLCGTFTEARRTTYLPGSIRLVTLDGMWLIRRDDNYPGDNLKSIDFEIKIDPVEELIEEIRRVVIPHTGPYLPYQLQLLGALNRYDEEIKAQKDDE